MRCPTCRHDNPPEARFCSNCGTALSPAFGGTEERRLVTVLFADLAGFTGLAEALDPEDLRAVIARFYALIAAEARRFGGTPEKYAGDAALVIFGLPEVHEDDAERAVRAGLAMGEALGRLNAELAREGRAPLAMRIGINTGEVVAAPHGGALGEFHLAADAINVAARLQQQGRVREAAEAFDRAEADLGESASPYLRLEIALGRHHLARAERRTEEADRSLTEAEQRARELRDRMEDPELREQFASSSWIVARIRAAREAFEASRARAAPADA